MWSRREVNDPLRTASRLAWFADRVSSRVESPLFGASHLSTKDFMTAGAPARPMEAGTSTSPAPTGRPLFFYETFLTPMNVNLFATIKSCLGEPISRERIEAAMLLTRREHPYARTRLADVEGRKTFVEDLDLPLDITEETVDSIYGDETWEERLPEWAALPRALDAGFVSLLVRRSNVPEQKDVLQVLATCNHGGLDAPGIFALFHSFFGHLGNLCAPDAGDVNVMLESVRSRPNLCILGGYPESLAEKPYFQTPPKFLAPPSDPTPPTGVDHPEVPIRAVFSCLTLEETSSLLAACRSHSATVQGALSVATDLACLKFAEGLNLDVGAESPDIKETVTVCSACPCSMRPYHPSPPIATTSDILCGSALLVWANDYSFKDLIWTKVAETSAKIKDAIACQQPLRWWYYLDRAQFDKLPKYTVMTSSVGVNPIQSRYGSLQVLGVAMLGSRYHVPGEKIAASGGIMTHVHTFDGRLHITLSYTAGWLKFSRRSLVRRLISVVAVPQDIIGANGSSDSPRFNGKLYWRSLKWNPVL